MNFVLERKVAIVYIEDELEVDDSREFARHEKYALIAWVCAKDGSLVATMRILVAKNSI